MKTVQSMATVSALTLALAACGKDDVQVAQYDNLPKAATGKEAVEIVMRSYDIDPRHITLSDGQKATINTIYYPDGVEDKAIGLDLGRALQLEYTTNDSHLQCFFTGRSTKQGVVLEGQHFYVSTHHGKSKGHIDGRNPDPQERANAARATAGCTGLLDKIRGKVLEGMDAIDLPSILDYDVQTDAPQKQMSPPVEKQAAPRYESVPKTDSRIASYRS